MIADKAPRCFAAAAGPAWHGEWRLAQINPSHRLLNL